MQILRKSGWKRMQANILDLHATPSFAELPARVLAALRQVAPYDSASIQDDRGGARQLPWLYEDQPWRLDSGEHNPGVGVRMMSRWRIDFSQLREAYFAHSAERHPQTDYYRRTGDGTARRLSEVISLRALRRTAFFNEISRPNGLCRQLTLYAPLPDGGTLTLAACRTATNFSDAECAGLDVLGPHVALAWTRALERAQQERALRELRQAHQPRGVWPQAADDAVAAGRLLRRRFGLAPRDADVLFWLAQGKTNAEIGLILNLKASTAKFYVGCLLARLGCETRTAAARTALEALSMGLDTHDA